MRYSIIETFLRLYNYELQLSDFLFSLIVISTVCIAAAGYVINDYFDRQIDQYNKPDEVIIGKHIDRRYAMALHIALNVTGILMGFYLAYVVKLYLLALVYLAVTGLFWYYSTNYKRQFLIGNIIVGVLTALVPLQVVMYEDVLLHRAYGIEIQGLSNVIFWWVAGFSFYAFLTNLIREIIKDTEDFEGDNAFGRNSIPVVLGVRVSKYIIIILLILLILALCITYWYFLNDVYTLIYIVVAIVIPVIFLIYRLIKASTKKDFKISSLLLKIVMLTGILYALFAQFLVNNDLIQ